MPEVLGVIFEHLSNFQRKRPDRSTPSRHSKRMPLYNVDSQAKVVIEKEGASRVTCFIKDKAYVPHSLVKAGEPFFKPQMFFFGSFLIIYMIYKAYD